MNYGSMLNGWVQDALDWIGNFFGSILDAVVKVIYFIFAAFCSGIDAMQALIRKLAGLDTYYQVSTGEAVSKTDPLTEFIYGILGIGENSTIYKGLSTVFWSLAIFGIIVLVVSTMVAIIKSHYNEDSGGTSPSKYIYTAIKSVLTFAVVPLAVVVGMQLSSFVLRTVDNITASTSAEEAIKGMYGAQATEIFQGYTMDGDDFKTYSNYDFFGNGTPTSTSTFGGMLFRATMYGANRARSGDTHYSNYQQIKSNGKQIFGDASNCPEFASLQSDTDKREYIAQQIDYAFINCLQLQHGMSYDETVELSGVRWVGITDFFKSGSTIDDFSKFDTSDVWIFYNMWHTNWIVGFGAGITIFGIMISIIVGLMSRLVKGAALFLVYPPLLGIAPLDNFKAFKGWVGNFMQQIMMAFGSIIGMNILLLLVPYMQQIAFFNIPVIDAIVQAVVVVAGLMMAKDFIGMVSGFVGGADASAAGEGLKGGIAGAFKTGLGIAGKGMAGTAKTLGRVGLGAGRLVGGTAKAFGSKVKESVAASKASKAANGLSKGQERRKSKLENKIAEKMKNAERAQETAYANKKSVRNEDGSLRLSDASHKTQKMGLKAYNKAIAQGLSVADAEKAKEAALEKGLLKQSGSAWKNYKKASKELDKEFSKAAKAESKINNRYNAEYIAKKHGLQQGIGKDGGVKYVGGFDLKGALSTNLLGKKAYDEKGVYKGREGGSWGDLKDAGKTMADGFLKTIKDGIGKGTGIDKMLGGATDIFKDMRFTSGVKGKIFGEGDKKLEGDKLQSAIAKDREKAEKAQLAATQAQSKTLESLEGVLKDVVSATKATTSAVNKLSGKFTASNNSNNSNNNSSGNSNS